MEKAVLLREVGAKRHFDLDDAVVHLGEFGSDGLHDVLAPKAAMSRVPENSRPASHSCGFSFRRCEGANPPVKQQANFRCLPEELVQPPYRCIEATGKADPRRIGQ
jgi:hypothetical protein